MVHTRMGDYRMHSTDAVVQQLAQRTLPHGTLVAVSLPTCSTDADLEAALASVRSQLRPDEWAVADGLSRPRRLGFVGGRVALRAGLAVVAPEQADAPVLRTARGAPRMPSGTIGSISHKARIAVALVSTPTASAHTIGVDVEEPPTERDLARPDLAPRILTPLERHELAPLAASDALAYREAVRLRFALKEAVYKAIDPHVQRYVRFQEVEVFPDGAGTVAVRLALPEFVGRHMAVHAYWTRVHGYLIATAVGSSLSP